MDLSLCVVRRLTKISKYTKRLYCFMANVISITKAPKYKTPLSKKPLQIPRAKYGGRQAVTIVPGAGVGPELLEHVMAICKFVGAPVDFEIIQIDRSSTLEEMSHAITSIKRNGVGITGYIESGDPKTGGVTSRNVVLRNELDLYVNVVHCRSLPVRSRYKNIDIVLIRQNTEGEYAMLEHETVKGVVESLKIITRRNTERVARHAFDYARSHDRRKVTTVHKANIMKLSDGLFLSTTRRIAKDYPEIKHNDLIIDNCCMQLVSNPEQFDVMIMPNLYGTILSNVICGLMGGAGLYAGRNYGDTYAVFEPATRLMGGHRIVGQNIANPVGMLNASVDLLEHLGHRQHARIIQKAIIRTIYHDRILTQDLGGTHTTTDMVKTIIYNIANSSPRVW